MVVREELGILTTTTILVGLASNTHAMGKDLFYVFIDDMENNFQSMHVWAFSLTRDSIFSLIVILVRFDPLPSHLPSLRKPLLPPFSSPLSYLLLLLSISICSCLGM